MNDWPNDEQVVTQLHSWLAETREEAFAEDTPPGPLPGEGCEVGIFQLAEELTALRHEIKLQTKSARKLQERNGEVLDAVDNLAGSLSTTPAAAVPAADEKLARSLVESLIGLDEALQRGRKVIESSRRRLVEESAGHLRGVQERIEHLYLQLPWWRRWLCRPWHQAVKEICLPAEMQEQQNIFASLVEGYELIQRRLAKSLDATQIQRIQCVGQPVDPQLMNVVEVIDDPFQPPGEVVEEVRPGYTWHGKSFRCAEVKAVRG